MASLSAAILARPPPQTAADPSPSAVVAAVQQHQHQQQQSQQNQQNQQNQLNQLNQLNQQNQQNRYPSSLPSPASTPSTTPPNNAGAHKPPLATGLSFIDSESLRDHLFANASSAAVPATTSRSRLSSPIREFEGDDVYTHARGHGSVDDSSHDHDIPGSPNARKSSAVADENLRRRKNKLRYRSKSSVTEQHPPFPDIASLAGFNFPGFSSAAPSASNTMDPPVLSFYGAEPVPLPSRFAHIKRRLAEGHHDEIRASWARLLEALAADVRRIAEQGPALIPSIDFAAIDDPAAVKPFQDALKTCGVGVVRGVVPAQDTAVWVNETRGYLQPEAGTDDNGGITYDIKPPPPQDPTCFDFFWTPAQVRARAHPNVLRAMKFAMGFWAASAEKSDKSGGPSGDPRVATRFPISYADRIRIHVDSEQVNLVQKPDTKPQPAAATEQPEAASSSAQQSSLSATPQPPPQASPAAPSATVMAQVDGGSLERWEPDGYGRGGTYDSVFRGRWEDYDPWDPAGRVQATPDLYNGAGACSIFRMFQGLLALTDVTPGMVRLLPSPKLATAYFLLRPFFKPKTAAPAPKDKDDAAAWAEFLAAPNWEMEEEPSTIIHGAVPGHAQRVTELWHPHLQLRQSLLTPPSLQAGDYIVWHCDTPYTITSDSSPNTTEGSATVPPGASLSTAPMLVYVPACPLTQTNALYLARQRKAFLRGHPGPDFDATGSGLGSEADHAARLGEKAIEAVGGKEGLRAMGLAPWDVEKEKESTKSAATAAVASKEETIESTEEVADADKMDVELTSSSTEESLSHAELELVRLANIILFPDQYEFYMPTRHNSPDRE